MPMKYFHFTLGPVQGFVAQARRTRDFWAGSFLLSWLSAVAIQAVTEQDGKINFPIPDDDYLAWLTTGKGKKPAPSQGCIPNRFKSLLATVPENFNAALVAECVQSAWKALAEQVWGHDLWAFPTENSETRKIWDRQVSNFWEISWALTDNESESNLLDRRKNWRTHLPPEEAGVKCMMMDGWQELSGITTPNAKALSEFWDGLRNQGKHGIKTDLREHEYLCAIAFIKRRFAHCFKDIKAPMPGDWWVHGWPVSPSVPSVTYMAAAPWLAEVLKNAPVKELQDFHDAAKVLTKGYGEYDTRLGCIDKSLNERNDIKLLWDIKSLDGNVFFDTALDNKNIFADQAQAQKVKSALKSLRKSIKGKELEPVSPFYAVLMMDGDSLGSQMSDACKQTAISEALNHFTQGVKTVVEEQSGFLIYAGGDDVLALLPLEFALQCAYELRKLYLDSFAAKGGFKTSTGSEDCVKSTLSGAIEYAHIKMPLGKVLADAHHLLDEVAKDHCGRDAIAVRVWKPGGQHLQWAMPWKFAAKGDKVIVQKLVEDFRKTDSETPFSNSFFYNIGERFEMLQEFKKKEIVQLIAAEYLNSGVNTNRKVKLTLKDAKKKIIPLVRQCMPVKRIFTNAEEKFKLLKRLDTDAAHFIRFLVSKGIERG